MNNTVINHNLLKEKFLHLVKETKPDYFLEIGAFEASASVHISEFLPNTECIAFEANPYNFNHFREQFSNISNLKYKNLAISNYDGYASFFVQLKRNKKKFKPVRKNNSLLKRNDSFFQYEEIIVSCNKLDSLYKENNCFCLWIDAEGKGFEVLEGAKKILKKTKYILIEVEEKKYWQNQKLDIDIIDYLKSFNFDIIYRDQEYESQYNILFGKKDNL